MKRLKFIKFRDQGKDQETKKQSLTIFLQELLSILKRTVRMQAKS